MTTGITFFMMSSGLITPIAAIPTPDLAVPQAAPKQENIIEAAHPIAPKKGLWFMIDVELPVSGTSVCERHWHFF